MSKRYAVVIHAPVGLVIHCSLPPFRAVGTRRTATHVSNLSIVDTPFLVAQLTEIRSEINLCLVECKRALGRCLRYTIAVYHLHLQLMCTLFHTAIATRGKERIDLAVEIPYRVTTLEIATYRKYCGIGLLVGGHAHLSSIHSGQSVLVGTCKLFWRTSCDSKYASKCTTYIFKNLVHNKCI